ncbi:MAG TPA: hypothetical protein VHB79_24000 [Polyangiaceae bacterium]|nr:hypothetical protein [Polyangiaceae bacterium]
MYDTDNDDGLRGRIDVVSEEVTRRTTSLADVEEPSFGRKTLTMMTAPRIIAEVLAGFGDQQAVLRYLERPKLGERIAENFADVGLRGLGEDQSHGLLLPERVGFGFVHESVELIIGLELGAVSVQRFDALVPRRAEQARTLGFDRVALFQRFLAREQDFANARETASGHLCFSKAGDLFRNLAGTDGARHWSISSMISR